MNWLETLAKEKLNLQAKEKTPKTEQIKEVTEICSNVANVATPEKQLLQNTGDPIQFLNERDVGIVEACPKQGIILETGFTCSQTLRTRIEFWAMSHFDELLAIFGELEAPIPRKILCRSLNLYSYHNI